MTATARKPGDLSWIRAYGWRALETQDLDGNLAPFGVVFNTIPSLILDGPLLRQLPGDCVCIDLASMQGSDQTAAEKLGLKSGWARSLPGRLVPRTAAAVIRDAGEYILEEQGEPV